MVEENGNNVAEQEPNKAVEVEEKIIDDGVHILDADYLEEESEPSKSNDETPADVNANDGEGEGGGKLQSFLDAINDGFEGENVISLDDETIAHAKELSPEDRRILMANAILTNIKLGKDDVTDSFIKNMIKMSYEDGFNINDYIASGDKDTGVYDWDRNTTDDNYRYAYNYLYGPGTKANLTTEEVEEEIAKASLGEKKMLIADVREGIANKAASFKEEQEKRIKQQADTYISEYNNKAKSAIDNLVSKSKEQNTFSGYFFSQADKEDYLSKLPNMLERKLVTAEDGNMYAVSEAEETLRDILKDGQSMLDIMPFIYLHKTGKLNAYTTMLKQQVKEEFLNKLDIASPIGNQGKAATAAERHILDDDF
jgi:hypothetical protein